MKESFNRIIFFLFGMAIASLGAATIFFWYQNTNTAKQLKVVEAVRDTQIAENKAEIERRYADDLTKKTTDFNKKNTELQKQNDDNEFRKFKSALKSSAATYGEVVKVKSEDVATYYTQNLHGPHGYSFDFPRAWGMPRAKVWYFEQGVFPGNLFSLHFIYNNGAPMPVINTSPIIESYSPDMSPRWFYSVDGDSKHTDDARLASFASTDSAFEACEAYRRLSVLTNGCHRDSTGAVVLEFIKDEGGMRCPEIPCRVMGTVWFVPIPDYDKGDYQGLLIRHDVLTEPFATDAEGKVILARYIKVSRPQQLVDGVKLIVSTFARNTEEYQ